MGRCVQGGTKTQEGVPGKDPSIKSEDSQVGKAGLIRGKKKKGWGKEKSGLGGSLFLLLGWEEVGPPERKIPGKGGRL